MNENTTLEIIAPTVEEAIAQGLTQLGLPAEAVSVEVLDAGTKGLFGLGGRQVRVRLTVHDPDQETAPEPVPTAPKAKEKPASRKKKTSGHVQNLLGGNILGGHLLQLLKNSIFRI